MRTLSHVFFLDPSPVRVPIQTGIQRKLNFVSVRTIKGRSSGQAKWKDLTVVAFVARKPVPWKDMIVLPWKDHQIEIPVAQVHVRVTWSPKYDEMLETAKGMREQISSLLVRTTERWVRAKEAEGLEVGHMLWHWCSRGSRNKAGARAHRWSRHHPQARQGGCVAGGVG